MRRPFDTWLASDPFDPDPRAAPSPDRECDGCGEAVRGYRFKACDGRELCPDCREREGWAECAGCHRTVPHAEWAELSGRRLCLERCAVKEEAGEHWCSGCEEWQPEGTEMGQRFAGRYCPPCWEGHKAKNSQVCTQCRRPYWDCYC